MELKELLKFIEWESKRIKKHFGHGQNERERTLARTVKMSEEVGELCQEVLASFKNQRPEKMPGHSRDTLSEEFADVIITTLLLAEVMNIDIEKALAKKAEKIKGRKY